MTATPRQIIQLHSWSVTGVQLQFVRKLAKSSLEDSIRDGVQKQIFLEKIKGWA